MVQTHGDLSSLRWVQNAPPSCFEDDIIVCDVAYGALVPCLWRILSDIATFPRHVPEGCFFLVMPLSPLLMTVRMCKLLSVTDLSGTSYNLL